MSFAQEALMETFLKPVQAKRGLHYSFRDFIESGGEESNSPFLQPSSRKISSWLGLPLSLFSAFLLAMSWFFEIHEPLQTTSNVILALVYFISGTRALQRSFEDILHLEINIDVLMTLAAYVCLLMGSGHEGALLLVMFDISRNMEHAVNQKARKNLMSLREMAPEKAWIIESSENPNAKLRNIYDIVVGTLIEVKAGEIVPLDGELESENASFSTAHLTGEALPILVKTGQWVSSGSQTLEKAVHIRVKKPANESTMTQIIRLIGEAEEKKPKLQRTFDELSDHYAKLVITLSVFFAFLLPNITNINFWGEGGALYRSLSFLIAASPCALILAIPIAYLSSLSACAKRGIVLKGGSIFDTLASCRHIAFDKTGTLTKSQPKVVETSLVGQTPDWILPAVLRLEMQTEHPLARAIIEFLEPSQLPLPLKELGDVKLVTGEGIQAQIKGELLRVGSINFALGSQESEINKKALLEIQKMKEKGLIVVSAATEKGIYLMGLEDQIRPGMIATIESLKKSMKMSVWMLTGDQPEQAKKTAQSLGIENWKASLKPDQKLQCIRDLALKAPLIMVGDGINDAPALAGASVGIAMAGFGSSAAAHAADVLLLDDDPSQIPWLLQKSLRTKRIIWQNLSLAGAAIIFASTAALLGIIPLWFAVVAHEGGTILVGLNGLRLMRKDH